MPKSPRTTSLLCVGKELHRLTSPCAVVAHSGHEAHAATFQEAEALLSTERFDLVILSATLSDYETRRIVSAVGKRRTIVLRGVAFGHGLLAEKGKSVA